MESEDEFDELMKKLTERFQFDFDEMLKLTVHIEFEFDFYEIMKMRLGEKDETCYGLQSIHCPCPRNS